MKLSIIIPYQTHNVEITNKLLSQLCDQLTNEVEIIVVGEKTHEFNKYPIMCIEMANQGVSKARNVGLDNCRGEYVCFIDSDDFISTEYIQTILETIDNYDFDYCTFGWESTNKQFRVIDQIPSWNTSVWNCIYKNPTVRFNENKQIGEDLEFNKLVRKGKSHHIKKILYYYDNQQENSLTKRFSRGEISPSMDIKGNIVIYRSYLSKIGGIETAIYNLCKLFNNDFNIIFIYDTSDVSQLFRLQKLVRCVKYNQQNIDCDTFIMYGFNPTKILDKVTAKDIVQQICCDVKAIKINPQIDHRVTKVFADSKASAEVIKEVYKLDCGVLHNCFESPKRQRVLRLMTASRLSWEKGYDRMKALAKRMIQLKIPFTWDVFTNDKPNENIDGMYFREPRLDVSEWMSSYDYGIQLSETESWCCTATEFLLSGTAMILTDFPSAKEQIPRNGKNGFILNRDLSNLDDVIHNMYDCEVEFDYELHSKSEWKKLFGKGSKSDYVFDNSKTILVKSIANYFDTTEQRNVVTGELLQVSEDRAKVLFGDNSHNKKFAELVE